MKNLPFCPSCGRQTLTYENNHYWRCSECGLKLYNNIAAAVGLIISIEVDQKILPSTNLAKSVDGKFYNVLCVKRGREPRKGFYALPGGFVDPNESAENACVRECKEETGYTPERIEFVCTSPNVYEYADITYKTCDMFFETSAVSSTNSKLLSHLTHVEKDEISGYKSFQCNNIHDLEVIPLAFESAKVALQVWLKKRTDRS
jgi:ADP-ribose pyrophosphatase YjhB (NUDIX family)